jgi:hypothetical protein
MLIQALSPALAQLSAAATVLKTCAMHTRFKHEHLSAGYQAHSHRQSSASQPPVDVAVTTALACRIRISLLAFLPDVKAAAFHNCFQTCNLASPTNS